MFYEKLAEKKQERANQGLSGGQMGAMAIGGVLGGAGTTVGTTGALISGKISPKFLDDSAERDALNKKYEDLKEAEKLKLFEKLDEELPETDFLNDVGDSRRRYFTAGDEGLALIEDKYKNHKGRLKDLEALNKKYERRGRMAIGIPALIGTAAGAYGAKKLYDKYRGNNQSNAA